MAITKDDLREMRQFREDKLFLERHKDKFRENYPNQWVAVFNKKIIASGSDLTSLVKKLKEKSMPTGKTVIEFLSTTEDIMVLYKG